MATLSTNMTKDVPATCPECGKDFEANLCNRAQVEGGRARLPCSPECNMAMVES